MVGFQELVKKLQEEGDYRPVGVFVLYSIIEGKVEFLITQSAKGLNPWYFPQGGVEGSESVRENLKRELEEELGINSKDVKVISSFYHYGTLDYSMRRKDKRSYRKGKSYLFTLAQYTGRRDFRLQPREIKDVKFVSHNVALEHFKSGRVEKFLLLKEAMDKALTILDKESSH